jgi:primosomal protein N' (replication factor Y)
MAQFIDVILPLPVEGKYTYRLPSALSTAVAVGCRVIVPFGAKKIYTAIVLRLHDEQPEGYEVKDILDVLDARPILLSTQLRLWQWIADYYICTLGEVYKAALPSGLKLESESKICCNIDFEADAPLPQREQQVLDAIGVDREQTISQITKATGFRNVPALVKSLLDKGALTIKEELVRSFKPKTETHLRLTDAYSTEVQLHALLDTLVRAPKQVEALTAYFDLADATAAVTLGNKALLKEVSKKQLTDATGGALSAIDALIKKNVLQAYPYETGRLLNKLDQRLTVNPLNEAQQQAMDSITEVFRKKNVCLLHGVTSSGKTEVYIHLIQQAIDKGQQVLYLLPEIALTTQITERLERVFGNRMGVYHSKFPDAERVEIWRKQLSDQPYDLILGVRSSIFLPFRKLGLVIVDEEHETSYKQQAPAPRYHARNAAIVLANMFHAKTLLGTATPSIETYFNATTGKYGLVEMKQRYKNVALPDIQIVNIKELRHKKLMRGFLSPDLLSEIRQALEHKEQVILFQNRRGFAPMIECHTCGWVPKCKNCDVSLTYHRSSHQLTCHYCGFTYSVPERCPACDDTNLESRGFGTEKVEDEIQRLFPDARVARMDLDTTRSRLSYERIIHDFQERRTDILIGTQMISKGLDFGRVHVVGILDADAMLHIPDFRSYERTFQMLSQVAGRAGRRDNQGKVILQTRDPEQPVIRQVVENNYAQLYQEQIEERALFHYPPYYRLIYIYIKHLRILFS